MKLLQLLLATVALLLVGCGGDDSGNAGDPTQRIYVLAASSGNASAASAGQDLAVTLSGVEPEVDWYSDRPDRLTGDAKTQDFVNTDWQRIYGDVAPNALLQFHMAGDVHGVFGSVRDVVYDSSARSLRLTLRVTRASDAVGAPAGSFAIACRIRSTDWNNSSQRTAQRAKLSPSVRVTGFTARSLNAA